MHATAVDSGLPQSFVLPGRALNWVDGRWTDATAEWRWIVSWKVDQAGTVSAGTYNDRFQRRNGVWKCLQRTSNVDPNWPAALFQPWVDKEKETFRAS